MEQIGQSTQGLENKSPQAGWFEYGMYDYAGDDPALDEVESADDAFRELRDLSRSHSLLASLQSFFALGSRRYNST